MCPRHFGLSQCLVVHVIFGGGSLSAVPRATREVRGVVRLGVGWRGSAALAMRARWPRVWAATQSRDVTSMWAVEARSRPYGAGRAVETLVGKTRRCDYPGTRVALCSKCGHASAVYYAQRTNLVDRYVRRGSTADRASFSAVPRATREVRGVVRLGQGGVRTLWLLPPCVPVLATRSPPFI